MQNYQGYPVQQPQQQQSGQHYQQPQQPQQPKVVQEVKFYKSAFIGFRSAPGRFQKDSHHMLGKGWHIKSVAFLGVNLFWQRVIAVVYEK